VRGQPRELTATHSGNILLKKCMRNIPVSFSGQRMRYGQRMLILPLTSADPVYSDWLCTVRKQFSGCKLVIGTRYYSTSHRDIACDLEPSATGTAKKLDFPIPQTT